MLIEREIGNERQDLELPFGYYLQLDADLLILRRPDSSFVAAFNAGASNTFEVEAAVWEDAD
jgi:hypothetical protein